MFPKFKKTITSTVFCFRKVFNIPFTSRKRLFDTLRPTQQFHKQLLCTQAIQKRFQSPKITSPIIFCTTFDNPPGSSKGIHSSCQTMGRENILHYQLEHDHETDLSTTPPQDKILTNGERSPPTNRNLASHDNFPFTLSKDSTKADYLHNNRFFVDSIKHNHGNQIFDLNAVGQSPHTLWIGCSDSRAGDACLATLPGEIFVHRNIANIVNANDISSQGVVQFAVDVLKVKKIIVCGHTDCGGIWASLSSKRIGGVLDLWLNPIRHIRAANLKLLSEYNHDPKLRARKLAELNVISSVTALKRHPLALMALKNGEIEVWGMMYDVSTGLLSELEIPDDEFEDLFHVHDNHIDEFDPH